jgi:peptidoglycan/LPS O-acetylase OafA/YrhL
VAAVAFWAASTRIGLTGRVLEDFTPREYILRHLLYAVIALGMVLPAVVGDSRRGIVRRVLANPALLFLGLISYSIYLYGPAVLDQLQRWHFHSPGPAYAGLLAVGGVITIAVSALSYYLVERPALSLKRLVPPDGIPRGEAIAEPAPAGVAGARER